MKPIFSAVLFLLTIAGCQYPDKSPDKAAAVASEQSSTYTEVTNNIDQLAKDILSSIKANNYALFSNYLSSKDTVMNFLENGLKIAGKTTKEIANFKEDIDRSYSKSLITTKTDFDYVVKKGTEQGITWNDVNYDKADWKLSKENLTLKVCIFIQS